MPTAMGERRQGHRAWAPGTDLTWGATNCVLVLGPCLGVHPSVCSAGRPALLPCLGTAVSAPGLPPTG